KTAVGLKSVIAYRFGLGLDGAPPSPRRVTEAAAAWLRAFERSGQSRLTDPVLLQHAVWAALELGLPLQFHVGYGDRDLDLRHCDPLRMTEFLRSTQDRGVPMILLHCYPFHRNAGYLAEVFAHVYFDIGLAITHVGARARVLVAESLELAPFGKLLFS